MKDVKLYPYQEEGVAYALAHHYCIIGDGMGLGKTLQAIEVIKRTGLKALIVCPAFLRETWRRELEKFSSLKIKVCKSSFTFEDNDVAIVSYSNLNKAAALFKTVEIVVADEVHYLKNPDAKRTENFHRYMEIFKPERFIGLSGTAIKNRIPEFYSLLALCSYNTRGTSGVNVLERFDYWDFCCHFSNRQEFRVGNRTVTKFVGHRNVDELRTLLKDKYIRRKASDVLDLPPIIRKDIVLDHDTIDHDLLKAYQDRNGKAFINHKVNSALIKVKHTAAYAQELIDQGEGPIIIFTDHVKPAEELAQRLSAACITGQTPMNKRDEIVQRFQAGKIEVLVATIGSLSVGVTLTRSRNIIFNDLSFVPGDIAQAEKRIHRIGQGGSCVIHRIFWGQVDVFIGKSLDSKLKTISEVL